MIKKSEVKRMTEFFNTLQELEVFYLSDFSNYINLSSPIYIAKIIILLEYLDMIQNDFDEYDGDPYKLEFYYWNEQNSMIISGKI